MLKLDSVINLILPYMVGITRNCRWHTVVSTKNEFAAGYKYNDLLNKMQTQIRDEREKRSEKDLNFNGSIYITINQGKRLMWFYLKKNLRLLLSVSCPSANEFSAILFRLFARSQILLDHFNVLDELWGEISTGFDNRLRFSP